MELKQLQGNRDPEIHTYTWGLGDSTAVSHISFNSCEATDSDKQIQGP